MVIAATSVQAKRYYFGILKININRLALSMITSSKLPSDLHAIKTAMAIPLVKFEEAKVDLGECEGDKKEIKGENIIIHVQNFTMQRGHSAQHINNIISIIHFA